MLIRGRAPLRISYAGGGTEISPYPEEFTGCVLSSTIDKYVYGTLSPRKDDKIKIYSLDYDVLIKYTISKKPAVEGDLRLVKAVTNRLKPKSGFNLFLHSDVPTGSGLGTSGAITSLMIGIIAEYMNLPLSNYEIAELAYAVENKDLKLAGGRQDQYAAVFGGFNLMEFHGDKTVVNSLRIAPDLIREMECHFILCYTKKTRESGELIEEQLKMYKERAKTKEALHKLKDLAYKMKDSLLLKDLSGFARLLHVAWEVKKEVNPLVSSQFIDDLYDAALNEGALAGKVLGAGGGGYLLLQVKFHKIHKVAAVLEKMGGQIVPFHFDMKGLTVWKVKEKDLGYKFRI